MFKERIKGRPWKGWPSVGISGPLAGFLAATALLLLPSTAPASSASGPVKPCNGSVELCDRTFDEVVLPGSHNSMSAADLGWINPNNDISIPEQLRRGARAMLIDTYYAKPAPNAPAVFKFSMFPSPSRENGSAAGATMYLCHVTCQWGASELIPEFGKVRQFLADHPREVLLFVNQDDVTPSDFARAVEESGLIDFTYKGSTEEWPTLQQMIDTDQRVVFLAEQQAGDVPWYHEAYGGPMQETDYNFERAPAKWRTDPNSPPAPTPPPTFIGVDKLTDPDLLARSCDAYRGGTTGGLFLMNHWVSGGLPLTPLAPDPALAEIVNTRQVLVDRARACESARGKLPTVLAVDFFGIGDVVGAARELNGVTAKPFLELSKPRPAVVRAGRTATFRVALSNFGPVQATGLRVCATVPSRLARPRTCVAAPRVPANGKATAAVKVRTKAAARGRATIRFSVASAGKTLTTSSVLSVKPTAKRR
jgi:uncharacterized repeat protein (TIGR01451 family)